MGLTLGLVVVAVVVKEMAGLGLGVILEDDLGLVRAHAISDEVEQALLGAYPGAEIIIHLDPSSVVGTEPQQRF